MIVFPRGWLLRLGKAGSKLLIAGILVSVMVSCVQSIPKVSNINKGLLSEDPAVRIAAIKMAGDQKDKKALGLLIERLNDTESDVRLFASYAIRKIVGKKIYDEIGWKPYLPADQREKAVQRWRKWLKNQSKSLTFFGDASLRYTSEK